MLYHSFVQTRILAGEGGKYSSVSRVGPPIPRPSHTNLWGRSCDADHISVASHRSSLRRWSLYRYSMCDACSCLAFNVQRRPHTWPLLCCDLRLQQCASGRDLGSDPLARTEDMSCVIVLDCLPGHGHPWFTRTFNSSEQALSFRSRQFRHRSARGHCPGPEQDRRSTYKSITSSQPQKTPSSDRSCRYIRVV